MKKIVSVIFCIVFVGLQTVTVFAYNPALQDYDIYDDEVLELDPNPVVGWVTTAIAVMGALKFSEEIENKQASTTVDKSAEVARNIYTRSRYDNMDTVEGAREIATAAKDACGFTDETLEALDNGTYTPPVTYSLPVISSMTWEEQTQALTDATVKKLSYVNDANYIISSDLEHSVPEDFVGPPSVPDYPLTDFGNNAYWVLKSTSASYNQTNSLKMVNGEHIVQFDVPSSLSIYMQTTAVVYNPVRWAFSNGSYGIYFPYYFMNNSTTRKGFGSPTLIDGLNYCYYNSTKKQYYAMKDGVEVYLPATYTNPSQYAYDLLLGDSVENAQGFDIVKNANGTYTNKTLGVTYDPSKDFANTYSGKTGTVTIPQNKVLTQTVQEYVEQKIINEGDTVTYTHDDAAIMEAIEAVRSDVVVQETTTTDTAVNENAGFFSNILAWLKSIWQKLVDGFQSVVEWLRSIWRSIAGVGEDVGAIADSITGDSADADTEQERMKLSEAIVSRFPFCLAWDMKNVLSALNAEPIPPKWEIPFQISMFGIDETVTIDLTGETYTKWFTAFKWFIFVGFVLCLITGTLYFIRN